MRSSSNSDKQFLPGSGQLTAQTQQHLLPISKGPRENLQSESDVGVIPSAVVAKGMGGNSRNKGSERCLWGWHGLSSNKGQRSCLGVERVYPGCLHGTGANEENLADVWPGQGTNKAGKP